MRLKKVLWVILLALVIAVIIILAANIEMQAEQRQTKDWTSATGKIISCRNSCAGGARGCGYDAAQITFRWKNVKAEENDIEETLVHYTCDEFKPGNEIPIRISRNPSKMAITEIRWRIIQEHSK